MCRKLNAYAKASEGPFSLGVRSLHVLLSSRPRAPPLQPHHLLLCPQSVWPLWPSGCSVSINTHSQLRSLFLCLGHLASDVCPAPAFTSSRSLLRCLLIGETHVKEHFPLTLLLWASPVSMFTSVLVTADSALEHKLCKGRSVICVFTVCDNTWHTVDSNTYLYTMSE